MKTWQKILLGVGGVLLLSSFTNKTTGAASFWEKLIAFVKDLEGFYSKAYWDYKQWTIGYGTLSYKGETITKEAAEQRLVDELTPLVQLVDNSALQLTDNAKIALVSFGFNRGYSVLEKVLKRLKSGVTLLQVANDIASQVYAGGKKNKGLVARRKKEFVMLLS